MVQVDVFWSYAIGAGFGAAAAAVATGPRAEAGLPAGAGSEAAPPARDLLGDRRFTVTVLFLACVFAPSGLWLLWRFTGWETMHAAASPADLPAWLVAAFAVTNVTQGILGYVVAQRLWLRGHRYLSWLQMPVGYLAMFFVLAYGWDGTGYRRFFSATPAAWRADAWNVGTFLTSDVALTLYGMGVVLVPSMLWFQAAWWHAVAPRAHGRFRIAALILVTILGLALGAAVVATVLLTVLGPFLGGVAALAGVVALLHRRGPAGLLADAFPLTARPAG